MKTAKWVYELSNFVGDPDTKTLIIEHDFEDVTTVAQMNEWCWKNYYDKIKEERIIPISFEISFTVFAKPLS